MKFCDCVLIINVQLQQHWLVESFKVSPIFTLIPPLTLPPPPFTAAATGAVAVCSTFCLFHSSLLPYFAACRRLTSIEEEGARVKRPHLIQRWANKSVFEYIRIVRTEYIRKSNYSVLFKNRIIFVFVFGRYFQTEYIRIRIRLLFFNRIYSYSYSDSVNIRIIFVF